MPSRRPVTVSRRILKWISRSYLRLHRLFSPGDSGPVTALGVERPFPLIPVPRGSSPPLLTSTGSLWSIQFVWCMFLLVRIRSRPIANHQYISVETASIHAFLFLPSLFMVKFADTKRRRSYHLLETGPDADVNVSSVCRRAALPSTVPIPHLVHVFLFPLAGQGTRGKPSWFTPLQRLAIPRRRRNPFLGSDLGDRRSRRDTSRPQSHFFQKLIQITAS